MADGTAQQCGRVGSCHILLKVLTSRLGLFLCRTEMFYLYELAGSVVVDDYAGVPVKNPYIISIPTGLK